MRPFAYRRADDPTSAIEAAGGLASPNVSATDNPLQFLAGGTTLIDLMKLDVLRPQHLIDINPMAQAGWGAIEVTDRGLKLGAMVRMAEAADHPAIRRDYPVIAEALTLGASQQLRNMASLGGNVLQRTRCTYFRDTSWPCNKREPGSGCSALTGLNRIHAVLGTSDACIATHPSDLAVALVALDARVVVRNKSAERVIPIRDFHLLPGQHPEREHALARGELITAIDVPALPFASRSLYLKVRDRASFAFALASAAVAIDVQHGVIRAARVALGGVGTKPWHSPDAERALVGHSPADATFRAAARAALATAKPHKDNAFKVRLAEHTLVRALTEVTA
jgi:xanthine dehydrogenase YagS FAD-binding subunit